MSVPRRERAIRQTQYAIQRRAQDQADEAIRKAMVEVENKRAPNIKMYNAEYFEEVFSPIVLSVFLAINQIKDIASNQNDQYLFSIPQNNSTNVTRDIFTEMKKVNFNFEETFEGRRDFCEEFKHFLSFISKEKSTFAKDQTFTQHISNSIGAIDGAAEMNEVGRELAIDLRTILLIHNKFLEEGLMKQNIFRVDSEKRKLCKDAIRAFAMKNFNAIDNDEQEIVGILEAFDITPPLPIEHSNYDPRSSTITPQNIGTPSPYLHATPDNTNLAVRNRNLGLDLPDRDPNVQNRGPSSSDPLDLPAVAVNNEAPTPLLAQLGSRVQTQDTNREERLRRETPLLANLSQQQAGHNLLQEESEEESPEGSPNPNNIKSRDVSRLGGEEERKREG